MEPRPGLQWSRVVVFIVVLLIAGSVVWQRLAREGRLPPPTPLLLLGGVALVVLLAASGQGIRWLLARETEDAAALRIHLENGGAPPEQWRDFSREYPLVFRPEWTPLAINLALPVLSLLFAIFQSARFAPQEKMLTGLVLFALVAGAMALFLARRLTVSWQGVTLRELRRERFWAWDEIAAVVWWDKRGRARPALRLRTMQGERELVSLGAIDFAREKLLFDVLLARVGRVEMQIDDAVVAVREGRRARLRDLLHDAENAEASERAEGPPENGGVSPLPERQADLEIETVEAAEWAELLRGHTVRH